MTLDQLWPALEKLPFAEAVRSSPVLFPWIESVHVLAIVLVVGTVLTVDLRLLMVSATDRPVRKLASDVLPYSWAAFALAVASGFLMFASSATTYAQDLPFRLKIALLALAGVNMAAFHLLPYRQVATWDSGPTPTAARAAGAISILCWIAVVACGRWVGFTTN
jgi:hypothetical protein